MPLCPTNEAKKVWDKSTKNEKIDIMNNLDVVDAKRELKNTENKTWAEMGKGERQILNESMEDIGFCLNEHSSARCKEPKQNK